MPIQALIYDIGGVLVRTVDRRPRSDLAAQLGLTYAALDDLVFNGERGHQAQRGEVTAEAHWQWVCGQVGWPVEDWRDFKSSFFAGDVLDRQIVAEIRQMRTKYRTAIISNAFDDLRAILTHEWQIADAFDEIIISGEAGIMKPDACIFEIALQALHLPASETLFVDDSAHNLEAARQLGMTAIHFQGPGQYRDELGSILAVSR